MINEKLSIEESNDYWNAEEEYLAEEAFHNSANIWREELEDKLQDNES